jgi:hypothetical protein
VGLLLSVGTAILHITPPWSTFSSSSRSTLEMHSQYSSSDSSMQLQQHEIPQSVAICAIQKGGIPYLEEWIDYNMLLGFDKIYLYDNSDHHELHNWTYREDYVDIVHFPGRKRQFSAYRHCAKRVRRDAQHTWVAFLDLDEFVVLKKHRYIFEFIEDILTQHQEINSRKWNILGGIALNWFMFDFNDQIEYQPLPLTLRFQRREAAINMNVKTIVNMALYRKPISPHAFAYRHKHAVVIDTSGTVLQRPTWFNPKGPSDVAVIHHMNAKSVEEYHQRCARGRADVREKKRIKIDDSAPLYCRSKAEISDTFEQAAHTNNVNHNLVMDDSAWKLLVEGMPEKYSILKYH